jgi:hypothetical protein
MLPHSHRCEDPTASQVQSFYRDCLGGPRPRPQQMMPHLQQWGLWYSASCRLQEEAVRALTEAAVRLAAAPTAMAVAEVLQLVTTVDH